METLIMKEAVVSADVVISRKTPVAFTNVLPAQIQEELAGRDLPLVLNTTPGVYATQQGGGDGDARVTIRGFDQTNLAVMVDGVPMNDMENGWVYWSNWAGIGSQVRTTQVQRGSGASKLAIPSVGGTINILTGGDESANGALTYQSEVGSFGYFRNSLSGVFGSHEKGFLHVVGSLQNQPRVCGRIGIHRLCLLPQRKKRPSVTITSVSPRLERPSDTDNGHGRCRCSNTTRRCPIPDGPAGADDLRMASSMRITTLQTSSTEGGASTKTLSITKRSITTSMKRRDKLTRPTVRTVQTIRAMACVVSILARIFISSPSSRCGMFGA